VLGGDGSDTRAADSSLPIVPKLHWPNPVFPYVTTTTGLQANDSIHHPLYSSLQPSTQNTGFVSIVDLFGFKSIKLTDF